MTNRRIPKVWNEAGLKCVTISLAPISIIEQGKLVLGRSGSPVEVHR